jgi:hypothetical protein
VVTNCEITIAFWQSEEPEDGLKSPHTFYLEKRALYWSYGFPVFAVVGHVDSPEPAEMRT